jgi:thioredoxin-like negative regulator of GroEL
MAAQYAESQGFTSTALKIWEQLLALKEHTVTAVGQILRLCQNRDDLAIEQRALHRLATQAPGDLRVAAESAERDVMVNIDPGPAIKVLDRQIAEEPGELRWRFAAALGELRVNNPAGALTRLEQVEIRDSMLTPKYKAIYAAILGANQQRESARRYSRQLASEKLRSQERDLIQPYL